jgi:hypothetical protein
MGPPTDCLTYVICVCSLCRYLQLSVGGPISYLRYLCLIALSLPPVVCRRAHVLLTLFVFDRFVEVKTKRTNTNNVSKTWAPLQTTGGKDKAVKHK